MIKDASHIKLLRPFPSHLQSTLCRHLTLLSCIYWTLPPVLLREYVSAVILSVD